MKNYHAILLALVVVVAALFTGCASPEEIACGWMRTEPDTVTAGPDDCVHVWTEGGSETRFVEAGASACEGESSATCVVLAPGQSIVLVRPIQNDSGGGTVHVKREIANKNGSCRVECE